MGKTWGNKCLSAAMLLFIGFPIAAKARVTPEGNKKTLSTQALEWGSRALQSNQSLNSFSGYFISLNPMAENPKLQLELYKYCKQVNEDFSQCILFDAASDSANLVGVEYVVSQKLYLELPSDEQKLWVANNYPIFSGKIIAPGLPDMAEYEVIKKRVNTYSKAWQSWNTGHFKQNDGNKIPLGVPVQIGNFQKDGQAVPGLAQSLQKKFNIDSDEKKAAREPLKKLSQN
jgi:Protein of unknown function (DUF1264)